jgi:hypothetical protein
MKAGRGRADAMTGPDRKVTRDERLAAKLRENLQRRKAQARSLDRSASDRSEKPALPKAPPKS